MSGPAEWDRIAIGYFIAWAMYIPPLMKQRKRLATDPDGTPPEYRLWFLLWSAYA